MAKVNKKAITAELWRRGLIHYKMHSNQREMYEIFKTAPDNSTMVWLLARQSGKSYCLGLIAVMECLAKPNSIVKLLTDTRIHAKTIFYPIFREIFDDCPADLKPEYVKSDSVYIFKNGSQIQMAGSDGGNAERLRGQKSDLVLIDEAGFADNLKYNVQSILMPTTTHTAGKIILASTPPAEPDHEFIEFIEEAETNRLLTKKTLFDNPMLTIEQKNNIVSKFKGGLTNSQFRREYMCEIVKDENLSVLPEVDDELLSKIVRPHLTPPFYDKYVAMDIGFKDLTVILFGYYDFKEDRVIIQAEIAKNGKEIHLPVFTKEIQDRELELWTNHLTNEFITPKSRVSDINPFVIQEIGIYSRKNNSMHPLDFGMPQKHDKLANLNKLRVMLANEKVIIDPSCETLIRHLKHCKWKDKTNKSEFARSQDDGHYDAVDALLYFIRSVDYSANPYPRTWGYLNRDLHIQAPGSFGGRQSPKEVYAQIFGVNKKKR